MKNIVHLRYSPTILTFFELFNSRRLSSSRAIMYYLYSIEQLYSFWVIIRFFIINGTCVWVAFLSEGLSPRMTETNH